MSFFLWYQAKGSTVWSLARSEDRHKLPEAQDPEFITVLDVSDIRRIMGISRVSAYELVHTPGFPAFRSGRLIKVSKKAFFDWMEKGTETLPKDSK